MFSKKNNAIKKIDKIITWVIIGWAVASAIWLSQTKKWKDITKKTKEIIKEKTPKKWINKILKILWKIALFWISLLKKK